MDIDEKIAEYKTDIEKCEHVCEVTAINSIRDAALRKAEDCRQMVEWLEDYKRLKAEKEHKTDVFDKIRAEIALLSPETTAYDMVAGNPTKEAIWLTLYKVFEIIDGYEAESKSECSLNEEETEYEINIPLPLEKKASSSEKTNKWIPISKEVPKEKGEYITSTIYNEVYCDYWKGDRFDRSEAVLAWCRLPLPYRAESEENSGENGD